jgi:heme A synthase
VRAIRRLAWLTLILAFGQIVFGAIVRITGSGMGCGDHWPQCAGYWIPPLERPDLIIEVTHRYIAAALTVAIVTLASLAFVRRSTPGVGGPRGVLRATALATLLVVAAALFGAATVKLELTNTAVIVTHLSIAMSLLAVLLVVIQRATPTSERPEPRLVVDVSVRTLRASYVASALVFLVLVLGALTAHVPGANTACGGFPLCAGSLLPSVPAQHVQWTHRLVAVLVLLHTTAIAIQVQRRRELRVIGLARLTVASIVLQVVIAAFLVELNLPLVLRSLHEAVGTLIWIFVVSLTLTARRYAARSATHAELLSDVRAAEARA